MSRPALIRLANALPKGDPERRTLLAMIQEADETQAVIRVAMDKMAAHPLSPGDILYSSWGYDQTNVDFYEVLAVTKATATIQKIEKRILPGSGRGQDSVVPIPGSLSQRSQPMVKRVRPEGSVKISSYSNAYPWDGKPKQQTSAGYGH